MVAGHDPREQEVGRRVSDNLLELLVAIGDPAKGKAPGPDELKVGVLFG